MANNISKQQIAYPELARSKIRRDDHVWIRELAVSVGKGIELNRDGATFG